MCTRTSGAVGPYCGANTAMRVTATPTAINQRAHILGKNASTAAGAHRGAVHAAKRNILQGNWTYPARGKYFTTNQPTGFADIDRANNVVTRAGNASIRI